MFATIAELMELKKEYEKRIQSLEEEMDKMYDVLLTNKTKTKIFNAKLKKFNCSAEWVSDNFIWLIRYNNKPIALYDDKKKIITNINKMIKFENLKDVSDGTRKILRIINVT